MGRQLAPELGPILELTGTDWPLTDEDGLLALANIWQKMSIKSHATATDIQQQVDRIVDQKGDGIEGVRTRWYQPGSPRTVFLLLPGAAEGISDRLIEWSELIRDLKIGIENVVGLLAGELIRLAHHDPRMDPPVFEAAAEKEIGKARSAIMKMMDATDKAIDGVFPPEPPPAPPTRRMT